MTWLWLILVVVVLGVTTAVAAGRGDRLRAAYPDRPDVRLPADRMVGAQDLTGLRFSVTLRGYRMDEVDDLVGRLTREIALRDAELARLSGDVGASDRTTGGAGTRVGGDTAAGEAGGESTSAAGRVVGGDITGSRASGGSDAGGPGDTDGSGRRP